MNNKLSYYTKSNDLLTSKEPIYMNRAIEQSKTHLHAHEFIEIAYVAAGHGIHCIGENEYAVAKGDLFIINYDIPHQFISYDSPHEPELSVYNCIFMPDFIDYRLVNCRDFNDITEHFLFRSLFPEEASFGKDIRLQDRESHEIEELYEKMYREYKLKEEGYVEILRAYVIELLITIFRLYRKENRLKDTVENQRQKIINKVIVYMKENYSHEIKLEDLSTMAFLSPNYFSRLFKECTSLTISEYIQKLRIEEACHLLKTTDRTVLDIAIQVGYRDIKHFNLIFKRINGIAPGAYRKSLKI